MNRMNRRRAAAAAIAALILVPLLSGCYNGFDAGTQQVGTGGDSAQGRAGDIAIQGVNWVRSLKNPNNMTLVANFFNTGTNPDVLLSVSTDPKPTALTINGLKLTGSQIPLPRLSNVAIGYNSPLYINAYGLDATTSSFIPTTFTFKNAGVVTLSVMTVPATGIFAGIEPNPETLGGAVIDRLKELATASPSGSVSPTPTSSGATPTPTVTTSATAGPSLQPR